jgi:hypothetical protein
MFMPRCVCIRHSLPFDWLWEKGEAGSLLLLWQSSRLMVGAERFELPTLWSQTRCATRLRYAPKGCIVTDSDRVSGAGKGCRAFFFVADLSFPAAACACFFDFHGDPYEQGQADAQSHLLKGQRLGFENRLQERSVDNGHL